LTQKFIVVVVGGNVVVVANTAANFRDGAVVDGTAVVGRGVVPVVALVVVGSTHAIKPMVIYTQTKTVILNVTKY
jgi:hypothetical protein